MTTELTEQSSPVTPIIDNAEKGTLTCPVCGTKGQRPNRRCCMDCGQPFYPDARRCKVCGTPLTRVGFCETCGKTYWEIDLEQMAANNARSIGQKRQNDPAAIRSKANIDPAKPFMIISLVASIIAMILFFVPTIGVKPVSLGKSFKVLDMADPDNAGLRMLFTYIFGGSADFWPPVIALLGLIGAIAMPINMISSLVKKNPLRNGRILYDAILDPFILVLSILVAKAKVIPLVGKINAAGWLCIGMCVVVLACGIISFIRLKQNSDSLKAVLSAEKVKSLKKKHIDNVLPELTKK